MKRDGFTLVELAIVLAIIGLLTGAVVAGQSMVRASGLRSVPVQASKYIAAVQNFAGDYNGLPGDLKNAEDYWGSATCPGDSTTPSIDGKTCNGDGDGVIATTENTRFWQQLANAGLIEGKYDGVTHGTVTSTTITIPDGTTYKLYNAPPGKLPNTSWFTYNWGNQTGAVLSQPNYFRLTYYNVLSLGSYYVNDWPRTAALTPEEMATIDTKVDDGLPGSGSVIGYPRSTCTASANSADLSAGYALTTKTAACIAMWTNAFRTF